jgi:hypothetical protein
MVFEPEKIKILDFKLTRSQIESPENFDPSKISGYPLDNSMEFLFNVEDKLAKVDFNVSVRTDSLRVNQKEASGNFDLIFVFFIENLDDLAIHQNNKRLKLNHELMNALSSVTYSTSRGILMSKLQGSPLQDFILPVINPNKLIQIQKD